VPCHEGQTVKIPIFSCAALIPAYSRGPMTASPLIQSKIIELCEALVADGDVQNARQQAEAFLADESAVSLYREMANLGRALHQKQHHDEEPTRGADC